MKRLDALCSYIGERDITILFAFFGKGPHPLYLDAASVRQHRGSIPRSSPEGA